MSGFEIKGFKEFENLMIEFESEMTRQKSDQIWKGILKDAMTPVYLAAVSNAPIKTGQLRSHIVLRAEREKSAKLGNVILTDQIIARVTSGAKREGDRIRTIARSNSRGRIRFSDVRERRPVPKAAEYGNTRFPHATHYLVRALTDNQAIILVELEKGIAQQTNDLVNRYGGK